jgi:hypothetical protein
MLCRGILRIPQRTLRRGVFQLAVSCVPRHGESGCPRTGDGFVDRRESFEGGNNGQAPSGILGAGLQAKRGEQREKSALAVTARSVSGHRL